MEVVVVAATMMAMAEVEVATGEATKEVATGVATKEVATGIAVAAAAAAAGVVDMVAEMAASIKVGSWTSEQNVSSFNVEGMSSA